VWFATVPGAEPGIPAAIGRCVVDGRWAGFAAVEVDPALRRQGLATTVMTALARRALAEGASAGWLQVETENTGARALYTRMGFATHHTYHHYREPTPPARGTGPVADSARGTGNRATSPHRAAADPGAAGPDAGAPDADAPRSSATARYRSA
jgi:hypothetical protein